MAIQISGSQIKNNAVSSAKMDLTGSFDFSSGTLLSATPSADSQVANKAYVDSVAAGLSWKSPAKVASTGNLTLSGTQTIDGIATSAGDRVLVKDQSDAKENGVYVVASGSWARSADMDANSDFPSASIFVQQGTISADIGYVCTNDTVTLGSTNITFVQFNGAANITAGAGLTKVGNTLDVNVDNATLEISSDALRIKNLGVGTSQLADGSVLEAKIASNAVTSAKIAASAVGSTQLADGSVVTVKLADGSVTSSKIVDANVTSAKIANSAVGTSQLADSGVTNAKLAGSITADKLSLGNGVQNNSGSLQANIQPDYLVFSTGAIDINFQSRWATFSPDGTGSTFDLAVPVKSKWSNIMVFKNGLVMEQVGSPSGSDQYSFNGTGGTGGVGRITFGSAPSASDNLRCFYIA